MADLARIKAPTLLVTGDCDPVAPVGMAQVLADGIDEATRTVLDRCGHWVTVEQAADAASLMADHLARHRRYSRTFGEEGMADDNGWNGNGSGSTLFTNVRILDSTGE